MRPSDRAWLGLAAGIVAYELLVREEDELMSVAMDRYLERHPWLTRAVVAVTALHLLNILDHPRLTPVDPFVLMLKLNLRMRVKRSDPGNVLG